MSLPTNKVNASRLRSELDVLGMDTSGSRSELVQRLMQAGVYNINTSIPPKAPMIDTSDRQLNHSCVYVGNGANCIYDQNVDNKLLISNNDKQPLISGDFKSGTVNIQTILNIQSCNFDSDESGNEGDIRRDGSQIYMYRTTGVHHGWYPILFGPLKIL